MKTCARLIIPEKVRKLWLKLETEFRHRNCCMKHSFIYSNSHSFFAFEKACIQYGCAKGYCWASCGLMGIIKGEWCWTTRGSMWDRNYVKCNWDWECEPHWHCAGACALFDTFNATNNNEKDNVLTNDV